MKKYQARSRWVKMLSRCEDDDNIQYHDYGGRGIYVCEEWREFKNFYNWLIENNIDSDHQIDRINNDGPYTPDNCRIVTRSQNARNKRNNVMLTAFGETKTMADWADDPRCAVEYKTLLMRIRRGWKHWDAIVLKLESTRKDQVPHNALTLTAFGESKTTTEWLKDPRCAVNRQTLWYRINKNWDHQRAITKPAQKLAA